MSTAIPRPQLNSDEMRRLKWLLGGMVALVSVWTVFFLDVEALSLVVGASVAISAALVWPQLPARIPVIVWRLSVPAIIAAVVMDFYFSSDTLPALIRLAILLVLYRAMSYRRKREDLQLIVLGLFLIVVAGVLTVSLGFAFLLLIFTACALGFLFSVTLIDMTDTGPRVMRPEDMREVPAWARSGDWPHFFARLRQVTDWRLIGFAAGLFVLVVGFSALLFTVIPRFEVGSGFFLDKYITRKSHTGFSETIKFGDVSDLVRDESVAMRVDVTDAASLRDAPYWRLIVLDEYRPEGFRMSKMLRRRLQALEKSRQTIPGGEKSVSLARTAGGQWTFYVEPEVSRFLPLPGAFGTLRLNNSLPVQYSDEQRLVALRSESVAMVAYQLEGVTLGSTLADLEFSHQLEQRFSKSSRKDYDGRITLLGPKGAENEAVLGRVVGDITKGEKLNAAVFTEKAASWLRTKHSYALSSRIPAGPKEKDDIVKWLDSNEPGFCEYFASALTVLCRAAGYPARVVGGFHGGTLNAFQNYYMVKNSEAHAWAEVFDTQAGEWFRADATPGANNVPGAENVAVTNRTLPDSSWSARFDSLRVIWYRRIVNFDARQQVQMIDDVKTFTTNTGNIVQKFLSELSTRFKAWWAGPWDLARVGKVVRLFAGLGLMIWASARAWYWTRLAWLTWWQPLNNDPVRTEAGRWLGELKGKQDSAAARDELVESVQADLLRLRYGPRESWPEPRGVFYRARQARRRVRMAKSRMASSR